LAAQVPVAPATIPHITFVNGSGGPCATCSLYTYIAGTTTPQATYTDSTGTSQNTNPIILDAAGGANIWLGSNSYKFILKDSTGATIWSVDNVNAGSLFPCSTAGAIQIANSTSTGLTCDPSITINTTTHTIIVGTLPTNHVTIGALGTPTSWTFDTTSPATALASLGAGSIGSGTSNQIAIYPVNGNNVQGSSTIPNGISVLNRSPSDNGDNPANTRYVANPGAINPTSVQIAAGAAMMDNQGNGAKVQHSTGATTANDAAVFDASGNVIDSGSPLPIGTSRVCNSNGCYRIDPDGTIEEWGITAVIPSSGLGSVPVTFPYPFSSGAVSASQVSVTTTFNFRCTTGSDSGCGGFVFNLATTGFTFLTDIDLGAGTIRAYWHAVGW